MRVALFMLMTLSLLLGWAAPGNAAQFIVLIDSDTNTGTGCQSNIPAAIDGVEFRIIATVADTPNPATVESVTLERCQANMFGSPSVIGGGQPLGVDNGVSGSDVIEFALGEALIQSALTSGSALIHFGSTGPGGSGAVLSASYSYTATGSTAAIPSLSDSAVIALALALAVLGWRRKGRAAHFGITLILVCTSGGLLIGAQFSADGNIDDWMGTLPLAQHPGGGPTRSGG